MHGKVPSGFSLVEVLVAVAVLGAALGGLVRLVTACVQGEAAARDGMGARLDALSALEQGRGFGQAQVRIRKERLEARATWLEGVRIREVLLGRWSGSPNS